MPPGRSLAHPCRTKPEHKRKNSRGEQNNPRTIHLAAMGMIDKEHIEALIDLEKIASAHNIPVILIGAGARLLLLDWKHGLPQQRTSEDWDFGARVMSWEHY